MIHCNPKKMGLVWCAVLHQILYGNFRPAATNLQELDKPKCPVWNRARSTLHALLSNYSGALAVQTILQTNSKHVAPGYLNQVHGEHLIRSHVVANTIYRKLHTNLATIQCNIKGLITGQRAAYRNERFPTHAPAFLRPAPRSPPPTASQPPSAPILSRRVLLLRSLTSRVNTRSLAFDGPLHTESYESKNIRLHIPFITLTIVPY